MPLFERQPLGVQDRVPLNDGRQSLEETNALERLLLPPAVGFGHERHSASKKIACGKSPQSTNGVPSGSRHIARSTHPPAFRLSIRRTNFKIRKPSFRS